VSAGWSELKSGNLEAALKLNVKNFDFSQKWLLSVRGFGNDGIMRDPNPLGDLRKCEYILSE
jgi:hypothetical protein